MQCGLVNAYECIKQFSETDFTDDLRKIDVPTLLLHGEAYQIVPVKYSGRKTARIASRRQRKFTIRERRTDCSRPTRKKVNEDLLVFLRS